jgi:hypothetical protein
VDLSGATGGAVIGDGQGEATITDNDPTPTVEFTVAGQSNLESVASVWAIVELSAASGQEVTVSYTVAGTASDPADYDLTPASFTIPAGDTRDTVTITVVDDSDDELDETVELTLGTATQATLGTTQIHTVTIDDDDGPTISINDVNVTEGDIAQFTVTLSVSSVQTVTVAYATTNGTAESGPDYTSTSGTLTFDPGVTELTIDVTTLTDTETEPDQTFTVDLNSPTEATLLDGSGTATILANIT